MNPVTKFVACRVHRLRMSYKARTGKAFLGWRKKVSNLLFWFRFENTIPLFGKIF